MMLDKPKMVSWYNIRRLHSRTPRKPLIQSSPAQLIIVMLRRILTSKDTVSKLPKKVFDDWSCRRAFLIYRFSLLSSEFADTWLHPHPLVVDLVEGDKIGLKWTNLPDPGCITIVSLLVEHQWSHHLYITPNETLHISSTVGV